MLQHVDMKHLKEECDIDGKDELQQNTAARTPMKKEKGGEYDMYSSIRTEKLVEKICLEKHTELN